MVDQVNNVEALAVDHSFSNDGEAEAVLKVEEKMIEIARIMVISVDSRLGELRTFIEEMVNEEKGRNKIGNQSRKKSKTQRELERLAFFLSIMIDRRLTSKLV